MSNNKKLAVKYKPSLIDRYYRLRSWYWQQRRLLFPSPAEVRFIELMGGKVVTFERIKSTNNGFPLAFVVSMGRILRRENIAREIRAGKCFIDFGCTNKYYKKGIEIDGRNWHQDIVKEIERDEYVAQYGWSLLHIQAADLYRSPANVQRQVINFLTK